MMEDGTESEESDCEEGEDQVANATNDVATAHAEELSVLLVTNRTVTCASPPRGG